MVLVVIEAVDVDARMVRLEDGSEVIPNEGLPPAVDGWRLAARNRQSRQSAIRNRQPEIGITCMKLGVHSIDSHPAVASGSFCFRPRERTHE